LPTWASATTGWTRSRKRNFELRIWNCEIGLFAVRISIDKFDKFDKFEIRNSKFEIF